MVYKGCAIEQEQNKVGKSDEQLDAKSKATKGQEGSGARRRTAHRSSLPADWAGVDGTLLAKAVASLARLGGALRLGYTRDGGAYAIGIYGDGDPFTEYVSPNDDINEFLEGLIRDYSKE
jgi:hypothetical protein